MSDPAPKAPPPHDRLRRREIPSPPAVPRWERFSSVPSWLLSLLFHVAVLVTISLLSVTNPKGTGGSPDRPIGIAVVYETAGGESYFLDSGAAALGDQVSTTPAQAAESLATATAALDSGGALLADLLPDALALGSQTTGAAGGLGLGDGGAVIGGNRSIPKARTTVFGIEGEGTRFLYVFDRSASMLGYGGAPLRAAKKELLSSIDSLGELQQFQIVFYNDSPHPMGGVGSDGPKLYRGDDASKRDAVRFIRDVTAIGGTRHIDALRMALRMNPDVIFFLTDADSSPPSRDIDDLHGRAARIGATIHTIQFGSGPRRMSNDWLERLATGTRGQYRYVDASTFAAAQSPSPSE